LAGKVALNSNSQVLHQDDMTVQTQIAMGNISFILEGFEVTINNLVKITAFYQGGTSVIDLHEDLRLRSAVYSDTGLVQHRHSRNYLVYEQMII
jgi:enamine deaminase RidA (YjgF/YER057c/UK114 family)|tara:strand:- start:734 stop:1015 length:282 start_codon:yes stop_codon:yes gene_type:complete